MKKIWKILIAFGAGVVLAVLIMWGFNVFSMTDTQELFKRLCDSFFIPGIVLFGFGILVFASNNGAFDMISYGVGSFFNLFRRDMSKRKHKDFYEYKQAKKEKGKQSCDFLIIAGVALIGVSLIFLVIYYYAS